MNSLYERLPNHAKSRWSILISFLWGFAEATVFFIVPDVYMGLVALFNWRKGLAAATAALFGAILGGSLTYILAMNNPTGINAFLTHIPLIDADLVNEVANQTRTSGLIAVLTGPFRGTPYKIYAAQAGEQSLPFLGFVLMTIPARLQRFFPLVLLLGGIGKWFESFCRRNTKLVLSGYAFMWVLIYSFFVYRFISR